MKPAGRRRSGQFNAGLAGLVAVAVVLALLIVDSLRLADALMPRVGDVLAFDPGDGTRGVEVKIRAMLIGRPERSCTLDPDVMLTSGGSLVIEAIALTPTRTFRAHWAGGRTSVDGQDCGRIADLRLNQADVTALTIAAGGRS